MPLRCKTEGVISELPRLDDSTHSCTHCWRKPCNDCVRMIWLWRQETVTDVKINTNWTPSEKPTRDYSPFRWISDLMRPGNWFLTLWPNHDESAIRTCPNRQLCGRHGWSTRFSWWSTMTSLLTIMNIRMSVLGSALSTQRSGSPWCGTLRGVAVGGE